MNSLERNNSSDVPTMHRGGIIYQIKGPAYYGKTKEAVEAGNLIPFACEFTPKFVADCNALPNIKGPDTDDVKTTQVMTIKLGNLKGVPTARAVIKKQTIMSDGTDKPEYITGDIIATYDIKIEPDKFQANKWENVNGKWVHRGKKLAKGKVTFYILKEVKKRIEAENMCQCCDTGKVTFKKLWEGTYIARYKHTRLDEHHICNICNNQLYPVRNSTVKAEIPDNDARKELNKTVEGIAVQALVRHFNTSVPRSKLAPHPELDRMTIQMPMKEVIDREIHHEGRLTPFEIEDPDYLAAIDKNASNSFIGWGKCDWSKDPDKEWSYGMEG